MKRLFVAGGAPACYRAATAASLRILMYHRFPWDRTGAEAALTRQFAYIRRHYHPVSLGQVVQSWKTCKPLPRRALAITVDDGYADFEPAWPLLKKFDLPATLFVVSGFLDRELWLWPDVVNLCLAATPLKRIVLELPGGKVFRRSLTDRSFRRIADEDLDALLIAMPDEARRKVIDQLPSLLEMPLPAQIPNRFAPLSWEALRRMASEGLEVGAHTRTHPIVARIASPEQLRSEIEGSRTVIESRIGMPVQHFCYPNGQANDLDARCVAAVQQAGFLSASTAQRGLNARPANPWELRRIGVEPFMAWDTFKLDLAGFRMR